MRFSLSEPGNVIGLTCFRTGFLEECVDVQESR